MTDTACPPFPAEEIAKAFAEAGVTLRSCP